MPSEAQVEIVEINIAKGWQAFDEVCLPIIGWRDTAGPGPADDFRCHLGPQAQVGTGRRDRRDTDSALGVSGPVNHPSRPPDSIGYRPAAGRLSTTDTAKPSCSIGRPAFPYSATADPATDAHILLISAACDCNRSRPRHPFRCHRSRSTNNNQSNQEPTT